MNTHTTAELVKKAYAYLTVTNLITKSEGNTLTVAYNRIKSGSPLSPSLSAEVDKMISLYKGMTV